MVHIDTGLWETMDLVLLGYLWPTKLEFLEFPASNLCLAIKIPFSFFILTTAPVQWVYKLKIRKKSAPNKSE